jgi:adenosylcobinamide hydrolase
MTSQGPWDLPELDECGGPVLVWKFGQPVRSISSAVVGGGVQRSHWILNLTVPPDYERTDPDVHLGEVAQQLGLTGPGVAMMTAVVVTSRCISAIDGSVAVATVGVRQPVWAADRDSQLPAREVHQSPRPPGTINLVCFVNEAVTDAALVNLVMTVTEAKSQALFDNGVEGTGTASDALCVVCPDHSGTAFGSNQVFGGPRSYWGSRLAVATRSAITDSLQGRATL